VNCDAPFPSTVNVTLPGIGAAAAVSACETITARQTMIAKLRRIPFPPELLVGWVNLDQSSRRMVPPSVESMDPAKKSAG
jgi:hypothetical protein